MGLLGIHGTFNLAETVGVIIGVLTVATLTFVIRDRRYRTMADLYEVERVRNTELVQRLSDCVARNATLEAQPNLEQHAQLLERLFKMIEQHEGEATLRAVRHEERAQARADATVAVLRQMSSKLEAME